MKTPQSFPTFCKFSKKLQINLFKCSQSQPTSDRLDADLKQYTH